MICEMPEVCRERFSRIDARMQESEGQLRLQREDIDRLIVLTARFGEKINMLANSMRALSRALWGMAGAVFASLLGFFFWYVQTC